MVDFLLDRISFFSDPIRLDLMAMTRVIAQSKNPENQKRGFKIDFGLIIPIDLKTLVREY